MKAIIPVFQHKSGKPLYLQLYQYIQTEILAGRIAPGEKLLSLRSLSSSLQLSMTTVESAYNQLAAEGYLENRPRSGYFVSESLYPGTEEPAAHPDTAPLPEPSEHAPAMYCDLSCFDFPKWKRCLNKVLNEMPQALLSEGEPQGEATLRLQISRYLYHSRGVHCRPDQIVIAAGTQQATSLLTTILRQVGLTHVAVEEPGYLPVRHIFRDRGFSISPVPVGSDGIETNRLPANIRCAAYVSPSNQFPTGAVMSVGSRYRLLHWAEENNSYIIEDDYDSELRYFGKPIPSLQSLDHKDRVIYLGSFSSTLFAAIKISYLVLPSSLSGMFHRISRDYAQTCSKTEQLTLALFMDQGYYQTGLKKLRRLYAQKLRNISRIIDQEDVLSAQNTASGLHLLLRVRSPKPASKLAQEAGELGVAAVPAVNVTDNPVGSTLIFYYNRIPLDEIESVFCRLIALWKQ